MAFEQVSLAKPPSDKKKKEEVLRARERRMLLMMQGRTGVVGLVENPSVSTFKYPFFSSEVFHLRSFRIIFLLSSFVTHFYFPLI